MNKENIQSSPATPQIPETPPKLGSHKRLLRFTYLVATAFVLCLVVAYVLNSNPTRILLAYLARPTATPSVTPTPTPDPTILAPSVYSNLPSDIQKYLSSIKLPALPTQVKWKAPRLTYLTDDGFGDNDGPYLNSVEFQAALKIEDYEKNLDVLYYSIVGEDYNQNVYEKMNWTKVYDTRHEFMASPVFPPRFPQPWNYSRLNVFCKLASKIARCKSTSSDLGFPLGKQDLPMNYFGIRLDFSRESPLVFEVRLPYSIAKNYNAPSPTPIPTGSLDSWKIQVTPPMGDYAQDISLKSNAIELLPKFSWTKTELKTNDGKTITCSVQLNNLTEAQVIETENEFYNFEKNNFEKLQFVRLGHESVESNHSTALNKEDRYVVYCKSRYRSGCYLRRGSYYPQDTMEVDIFVVEDQSTKKDATGKVIGWDKNYSLKLNVEVHSLPGFMQRLVGPK